MPKTLKRSHQIGFTVAGIGLALVFFSCWYLEISPMDLLLSFPDFISFFTANFLPPNFSDWQEFLPSVLDTIFFAIVATYISTFFAMFFGLMMSELVNPFKPLRVVFRGIVSFFRNIPVMIWASLLVYAFGVGELVGLIALVIATIGFLSRSYADSINELDKRNLEALKACGASPLQVLWHGTLVLFKPSFINWTLYCFELNIRSSTILGMVGAGGIGVLIQTNIKLFRYETAFGIILIVIVMVLCSELLTNKIRERIH